MDQQPPPSAPRRTRLSRRDLLGFAARGAASVAVSQSNGAQIVAGPALQWPVPSQTSTSMTAPFEHVPGLHTVPAA